MNLSEYKIEIKLPDTPCIYRITNTKSGSAYIGQTARPESSH